MHWVNNIRKKTNYLNVPSTATSTVINNNNNDNKFLESGEGGTKTLLIEQNMLYGNDFSTSDIPFGIVRPQVIHENLPDILYKKKNHIPLYTECKCSIQVYSIVLYLRAE
jgi:hypothetical protein